MASFKIEAEKFIEHPAYDDTVEMKLDLLGTVGEHLEVTIDSIGDWYTMFVGNARKEDLETIEELFANRMYEITSQEEWCSIAEAMERCEKYGGKKPKKPQKVYKLFPTQPGDWSKSIAQLHRQIFKPHKSQLFKK